MMIIRRVALSHSDLDLMSAMVTFLLPLTAQGRGSSIRESANTPFGDLSTERWSRVCLALLSSLLFPLLFIASTKTSKEVMLSKVWVY